MADSEKVCPIPSVDDWSENRRQLGVRVVAELIKSTNIQQIDSYQGEFQKSQTGIQQHGNRFLVKD